MSGSSEREESMKNKNKIPAALLAFSAALCCMGGCESTRVEEQSTSSQQTEATPSETADTSAKPAETSSENSPAVIPGSAEAEPDNTTEKDPEVSEEWSPKIDQRQTINDSGDVCGIVYIGYIFESGADASACREVFVNSEYAQEFPEICNIPDENCVGTEGGEVYLVIPGKEEYKVTVYRWVLSEENDYMGEPGEVIYSSDRGTPFLLKCNVSDIMQDTLIEITDEDGNKSGWSPWLSLRDGTVGIDPDKMKVYDFTKYTFEPEPDEQ